MTTALITHLDCLAHKTPEHVHEQPARLNRVLEALDGLDLDRAPAPRAWPTDVNLCHDDAYVSSLKDREPKDGFVSLDEDTDDETYLSPTSMNAILRAAGGAIRAVDMVLDQEVENAFVAVRPPGHHAEQAVSMGFCMIGNVALAAKHALERHGLARVAIVDFDVHHGNGTQALLQDEPRVLVVSSHQMPLWPNTGDPTDRGPHQTFLNVAFPPGSGGDQMRQAYSQQVFPAVEAFKPELILVSAGFDAHQDDPLADLNWSRADYAWLTEKLANLAQTLCEGRLVSVLEGGYDLDALADCVKAHVDELVKAGS